MEAIERPFLAFLDELNIITILLPYSYHNGRASSFTISSGCVNTPLKIIGNKRIEQFHKYTCMLNEEIDLEKTYWISNEHRDKTDLQIGAVIRTAEFDEKFYYCGSELGVTIENGATVFKLWAPTATGVKIKLTDPARSFSEMIKMKREDKGVWSACCSRDLEYFHYTFLVCINLKWQEAVDPYARAVTPNGEQGVIVKMKKTKESPPALPPFEHPVEAIIYETHIRDFTIHPNSGIQNKGLFLGAGEARSKGKDGQLTGLSYVKSLGITHIEFLPFNDFAGVEKLSQTGEYNWGYNPLHFNVPEGSYSTNPANPYSRITELKQCIDQIHQEGLRVIMDVVYNHVYIREQSSFEKIVPGYFFRHNEMGLPSNGTGVGNDFASERMMARKFILDSIRFWLEKYDVDGFRFDLMGILDIGTMNEIRKIVDGLKKGVLLLGEGWNLNTPLPQEDKATIMNQAKIPKIAQFNDQFRDSIKGSTFNLYDKGYAFGNEHYYEPAREAIAGSIGLINKENRLFNEPFQSINYVECHDNHTLWDKLKYCFPTENESLLRKQHRLATCIVLLSQGIPFLHSGQEFFRTKYGVGNSYRSKDTINQLDWDRKWRYSQNVDYIKGIISIRKKMPCFRMRTAGEIRCGMQTLSVPPPVIGYTYQQFTGDFKEIILLINPTASKKLINLPEGEWIVFADDCHAGILPLRKINSQEITLEQISLYVLAKK